MRESDSVRYGRGQDFVIQGGTMKRLVFAGLSLVLATVATAEEVAPDNVEFGEYQNLFQSAEFVKFQ